MLQKNPTNVLPLHLAPIDSFFLADDQPRYPMASIIQLSFEGCLDPDAFEFALASASARHPLTRAVIRPAKRGLPCWVADATIRPHIDYGPLGEPVALAGEERIDLVRGVRIAFLGAFGRHANGSDDAGPPRLHRWYRRLPLLG